MNLSKEEIIIRLKGGLCAVKWQRPLGEKVWRNAYLEYFIYLSTDLNPVARKESGAEFLSIE